MQEANQNEKKNLGLDTPLQLQEEKAGAESQLEQDNTPVKKDTTTIPEELIKQARSMYGEDQVKVLALPKDDYGREFLDVLVRVPSRTAVGEYEKYADRNPLKAKQILIEFCMLRGKQEVLADDGLFNSAVNGLAELIPIRKAIVKNL